jgi:hypothetical protein
MGGQIPKGLPTVGIVGSSPRVACREIRMRNPGGDVEAIACRSDWRGSQENPLSVRGQGCPYCKPTQVGEESILRRSREPSLRNSANLPRNFGIRGSLVGEGPRARSYDQRDSKAPHGTVYQKHSSVLRPKAYVYSATLARCR